MLSGLQGEGGTKEYIYVFVDVEWVILLMDTRRKLLLIRYRFGELIID